MSREATVQYATVRLTFVSNLFMYLIYLIMNENDNIYTTNNLKKNDFYLGKY